ncbi:hypothetical protein EDD18DRAFT_1325919 [Armillaria luteobubalina]|uniref:Uncharacterized protein n=1 Tax=Armillaria luteobubalina TaxID=153913 RepID=A0AA39TZG9_9AGAR|nr:hypothetical protein EDD18DRAFT_1325919 [Armillaria luteobubalina]
MLAFRLRLLSTDAFRRLLSSHKYEYFNFHDFLHADSLLRVSTQYCFENRYTLLSLLGLLLFVSVSFVSKQACTPKENTHLQALSTVVIPTRNRSQSIKNTVIWNEQRMEISLTALIENIKSGDIEMRNSRADLSAVFRERLKVYGWTIGLDVEPMWSAKTTIWLLKGHRLCFKIIGVESKAPAPLLLSEGPSTLLLDVLPHAQIDSSITSFIKSIPVGSTATIEFTIVSPQIVWMSKDFILCSLPLRTPMPHLVSFSGVLSLCAPAKIKSIVNISKRYADALSSSAERLVKDRADRIAFVDQYGLNMWREQRFLMYWEAALLDVGHVTRWIVELQK